jgi:dihydroorotate dehydrogenase electron transfer subunit
MSAAPRPHRDTIFLEEAPVLAHTQYEGEQHVLRLEAPRCAARAVPGSFVHLRCDETVPMRRPLSIMRAEPAAGWIELLYRVTGPGTRALSAQRPGRTLSVLGPIGNGFRLHAERPRVLAVGGGVGIPPMIFLAETLQQQRERGWKPLVLMGSETPFPFRVRPSMLLLPGMPAEAIGCMPMLDEWRIPSRLASLAGYPGCFDGYVTELARRWLASLAAPELAEIELFACGPLAMLRECARLAREFELPCQVAMEEYMACATGGCAGCTVEVRTPSGAAMKRVCVDGPVFDAASVFPA